MNKSVDQLRREAEQSRAKLSSTAEILRDRITERTSPEAIKGDVRDYVADKATGWAEQLKHQAMENPLQALAAGSAIAWPVFRLARAVPLPILLIGAGFVLSSSKLRGQAADALAPALKSVNAAMDGATDKAQDMSLAARQKVSDLSSELQQKALDLRDSATETYAAARDGASDAVAGLQPGLDHVKASVTEARAKATEAVFAAPAAARDFIKDNAALIGGVGLAIGALVAASLPATTAEAKVAGAAGSGVRNAAGAAARSGVDAAKAVVMSAADAATETLKDADLPGHASRMAGNLAETLKTVAADTVTTAFDPSNTSNHSSNTSNHSEEARHD